MDLLLKIVPTFLAVAIVVVREITKILRATAEEKMRINAEEIAVVVEALYNGYSGAEKLEAFKSLCVQKKIDVEKAVKYLETKIIPVSKYINSYIIAPKKDDDKGVTD